MRENNLASDTAKPRSLAILPESMPLRQGGPLLAPVAFPPQAAGDPPRALRGLARIIDGGLCHRCGTCVGICPTGVLALDGEEYPFVKNLSACTDCDLCVKVCPGDEFDYQAANQDLFSKPGDLEDTHGHFSRAVVAHATDPLIRDGGTSGGMITGLLLHLLESGQIDGAVVIGSSDDPLWKGRPMVARTREEILGSAKSKYAISPTNSVFNEIRNTPGRYALVGLPCQIHGYLKAARLDERIRERVVLTIGIFCHAAIEHDAFRTIWETLGAKANRAVRFTSRIGKHPGAPHIELDDGTLFPVYFGDRKGYRPTSMEVINILYRLFTPERCLTCFDGLSEFADISVGDPWLPPPEDDVNFYQGWSFALIRTARGAEIFNRAVEQGRLAEREITRREALVCNEVMSTEKHWRAFRVIETHKRQGKPVPRYFRHGFEFPQHRGLQFVKTELHMLTHIFCYLPNWRSAFLKFMLGPGGYWLFWLNSRRRNFKVWKRDTIARFRRQIFGRS